MPSQGADPLVFGLQVSDDFGSLGIALAKLPKYQILFGMMASVGKSREILPDPRKDIVVRRLGGIEYGELMLQGIQQLDDVSVLQSEPVHDF